MDDLCYNCHEPGHISRRCPSPQMYTRCHVCRRVCRNPNCHYFACSNREFVSECIANPELPPQFPQQATLVADIKLVTKSQIYLSNDSEPLNISGNVAPIQINSNGLLLVNDKNIKYFQWHPAENQRCVINIANARSVVRCSLCLLNGSFVINKRIRVRSENGVVEYRENPPDFKISESELTIQVDTVRDFNVIIYKLDQPFTFKVSSEEIIHLPENYNSLECPICYEDMTNENRDLRYSICGHIFCTSCISRSLQTYKHCPICRNPVRMNELRPIFLQS